MTNYAYSAGTPQPMSGPLSARPATAPPGSVYYTSDNNGEYIYDSLLGWILSLNRVIDAVRDYGADPTGVNDSATAINNAIAAAGTSLVTRKVWLRPGTYMINSPISIGNGSTSTQSTYGGVVLEGSGPPPLANLPGFTSQTSIVPGPSFSGSAAIIVAGPIEGWGLQDIGVDNSVNSVANLIGIQVFAASGGRAWNLTVNNVANGIVETTRPTGAQQSQSTYNNSWKNIWIQNISGNHWILTSNTTSANTTFEDIENVWCLSAGTGGGIKLKACDSNRLRNIRFAAGTYTCLQYDYTSGNTNWPNNNTVENIDFFNTTVSQCVSVVGTPGANAKPNVIRQIDRVNGIPSTDPNLVNITWIPGCGLVPTISMPGVPLTNTNQVISNSVRTQVWVQAAAGGTCGVTIGGTGIMTIPAGAIVSFEVQPGEAIKLTYTSAPTWTGRYVGE